MAKLINRGGISMSRKWSMFLMLIVASVLLSACMYPEEEKAGANIPYEDQLADVQSAVEKYQADTGVLPIQDRDMDTDIYIKYPIDFSKLVPKYMAKPPTNSYEKGGIFQYVIWDAENNPTVKLVDLRSAETIRDLNIRFTTTTYPTYKEPITNYIYTIDFKKVGYKEDVTVPSPYSNNQLPLIVTTAGKVYVDYSMDLNQFIMDNNLTPKPGEDIRNLLVEAYPVLPAYSLPYTVDENNEPVFMYEPTKK